MKLFHFVLFVNRVSHNPARSQAHYGAKASLELMILLLPPECGGYRCVSPRLALSNETLDGKTYYTWNQLYCSKREDVGQRSPELQVPIWNSNPSTTLDQSWSKEFISKGILQALFWSTQGHPTEIPDTCMSIGIFQC